MHVGLKLLQCSASNFIPICLPALAHMTTVACVQIFDKITHQFISSIFLYFMNKTARLSITKVYEHSLQIIMQINNLIKIRLSTGIYSF